MEHLYLLKGIVIGFSIAAPVGPIGLLCIQRTLNKGQVAGLVTGLGAAVADGLYGCIAGFGLTFIANLLISYQTWIRLIGGLFLCYLAAKTYLARPADRAANIDEQGLLRTFVSTFFLTITNPMTIISFMAIFAGIGVNPAKSNYFTAVVMVAGVFTGSALWWLVLSFGVHSLRTRLSDSFILSVNKISGTILLLFGIGALISISK